MSAIIATTKSVSAAQAPRASITVSERFEDVADAWAALERDHCVLASQKLGVVRAWIESRSVSPHDCVFILISLGGAPVVLLPLMRRRLYGLRVAGWFMGEHFGSYAPLTDAALWASIPEKERTDLWRRALGLVAHCDLVHLPDVPQVLAEASGLGAVLGRGEGADCVHVARYADWQSCDAGRRDKHRRKIDRQQGNKLAARGVVSFETFGGGEDADQIIETMFEQRSVRFRAQGIRDPFSCRTVKAFYKAALRDGGGILHVLRLDGQVIAVRYNLCAGGGLYSLVTSMHPDPGLQAGSPGKQNLLNVMQTAFDAGYGFIDMGKGDSDEKRLWCNERVPLMVFDHPLTAAGLLGAAGLAVGERAKGSIKARPKVFEVYRRLRSRMGDWGAHAG